MGAWDTLPWDNDKAADWYDELFDHTQLARKVEDTLKLDPEDSHEEIRAAASILLFLGRPYIWPIHDLNRHLQLAAESLEQVACVQVIAEAPEFVEQIRIEITELRNRITEPPSQVAHPQLQEKKWWKFWQ
jgi:hypothetical protein